VAWAAPVSFVGAEADRGQRGLSFSVSSGIAHWERRRKT
jgi:hypothetical protein